MRQNLVLCIILLLFFLFFFFSGKPKEQELMESETTSSQEMVEVFEMNEAAEGQYLIRDDGHQLMVYDTKLSQALFPTGIKTKELPEGVQDKVRVGIYFNSLEEVYEFLENYSS